MKIYKVIIIVKYTAESSSSNSFRWNLISAKEKQNQWRFSEKFTDEGRDLELFLAQKKTSWNSISQIWHFCKFLSVTQIACNLLWEPLIIIDLCMICPLIFWFYTGFGRQPLDPSNIRMPQLIVTECIFFLYQIRVMEWRIIWQ